ncbi:S41 family peptidase [Stackebrandtia soli]|uniref:S41 family peptidase n=1 Tax=Stackebrandtia soli TaxID=1892856 RepID=UPI0039ED0CA4
MTTGYPRFPAIHGDTIVFVAEDDLWKVSASGGVAQRITAGLSAANNPRISPDGTLVAYGAAEEGPREVHVVPITGGQSRRLTFEGGIWSQIAGWDGDDILFASNLSSPNRADLRLHRVSSSGGLVTELGYGRAGSISFGPGGAVVLGREYWKDSAHWKRYRGGTAGRLWIDADGDGEFSNLINLDGNLSRPHIIGERVYFLSDHEGYGNVYSCAFDGSDLRRHTDHADFYARSLSGDADRLVYHCGGRLFLLDPSEDQPVELDVYTGVTRTQRARRFVEASEYLHSVDIAPDGSRLAITARGKAFAFSNWEGAVTQFGEPDGVRYRLLRWLHDGERMVAVVGDTRPAEALVEFAVDGTPTELTDLDIGRSVELVASPTEDRVAIANHRNELLLIDLAARSLTVVDRSAYGQIGQVTFSPDGQWLAYACPDAVAQEDSDALTAIKVANLATGETALVADRVLRDDSPAFDPDGKYLYFIGRRQFNPVYDSLHFDLGFPKGSKPYAVTLHPDTPAPFVASGAPVGEKPAGRDADKPVDNTEDAETAAPESESADQPTEPETTDTADAPKPSIVLEGIRQRIVPLPLPDGVYTQILGTYGKVLVLSEPIADDGSGALESVDVANGKVDRLVDGVDQVWRAAGATALVYRAGDRLRVIKAAEKAPDGADYDRESGWIDLSRVKVSVRPELEWPQMFREGWRLIGDHFWDTDIVGIDWAGVYTRYAPLVDQVSTRTELSDLFWEMNGELGTSHAYEGAGDHRVGPYYGQGYLGATFGLTDDGHYRVDRIREGDVWDPESTSPLRRPGVDVAVGDVLLSVNGLSVAAPVSPAQRLVNLADQEVRLTIKRGDEEPRDVVVRALADESQLRYREWVESNRRKVHEASDGVLGYIHIPDMGPDGFAEFHRGFLNEYGREGLVVDVRYNGGGHVSSLLIEKLARRRIGHDYSRWNAAVPHPIESPRGPMVALIDELAGSDGDIFSQVFRQLKLGPLIGTRTWGGVVGYRDRPGLSDNTFLSQPEFAFHFEDSKWSVENYGVAPDIEVPFPPQAHRAGRDPQLDKAIEVALAEVAARPAPSEPAPRPRLTAPPLPPRA